MKKWFAMLLGCSVACGAAAQAPGMKTIELGKPSGQRGMDVMQALRERQSTREFAGRELSLQDLSDLCWAANGVNRPASGKRTAPSAMNRQDIKVYVCTARGNYLYDAAGHKLVPVSAVDARPLKAPVCLVLVADNGETWNALDAGIVSQNISVFCAAAGLGTVPRATMNQAELKKALILTGTQTPMLNHPVGYFK